MNLGREVVEDTDSVTLRQQSIGYVGAYKSSTAGDKDLPAHWRASRAQSFIAGLFSGRLRDGLAA